MTFQSRPRPTWTEAVPLLHTGVVSREVVFLLLDGFTHLTFAAALEPLRLANEASGQPLYSWRLSSEDGGAVTCSNGTRLLPDGVLGHFRPGSRLIVVGGTGRLHAGPRVLSLIQGAQAHGAQVIGLCGGVGVLARAGLLSQQSCAVHWQMRDTVKELFPELQATSHAFVAGRVPTAAGGTAAADLMLHLLAEEHGSELASKVADLMLMSDRRGPEAPQTVSMQARLGIRNAALAHALRLMEEHVEHPLDMPDLARRVGLSVRQVERLFSTKLGTSPNRHYVETRLERARRLLVQSELSIAEIALACGFDSPAHFARRYQRKFGTSARRTRTCRG